MSTVRTQVAKLSHKDVRQRRRAVRHLFEENDPLALSGFIPLLADADPWFRDKAMLAVRTWVRSDDDEVVQFLSESETAAHRALAAEVAPRLRNDEVAGEVLVRLCADAETSVMHAAWTARLQKPAPEVVDQALDCADHIVRRRAAEVATGAELVRALGDAHSRVRQAALAVAGSNLHDAAVLAALDDCVAAGDARAMELRLPSMVATDLAGLVPWVAAPTPRMRKALVAALADVAWWECEPLLAALGSSEDILLLPRLLRSRQADGAKALRRTLLGEETLDNLAKARLLEHMVGRPLEAEDIALAEDLAASTDTLLSQSARMLLADHAQREGSA